MTPSCTFCRDPYIGVWDIGADWYVSSVFGSDANDGKSPDTPFQTIAKLTTVFLAGQTAGLRCGSHWRERLSSPGNDIQVSSYGTGSPPLLDCSVIALNAGFIKTGGAVNVYEIAVVVDFAASEPHWNSVWENDTRLVRVNSVAACDAAPGSMYASNDNAANVTLYVHATDSSSVITNGKVYEYAKLGAGFYSYFHTGTVLRGVRCRRNLWEGGSIKVGRFCQIYSCIAEEGNKHSVYVRSGCLAHNVIATKGYYTGGSSTMFVYNDDNPAGEGVTFSQCQANLPTPDPTFAGFYGHYNIGGSFGQVLYDQCSTLNLSAAFQGINASSIIVRKCMMVECSNGVWMSDSTPWVIEDSDFTSTSLNPRGLVAQAPNTVVTVNGYRVVVPNFGAMGIFLQAHNNPTVTLSRFILDGRPGDTYGIRHTGVGGTIIVGLSDFSDLFEVYHTTAGAAAVTSDYNRFRQDIPNQIQGVAYGTIALYQAGTGQDANSIIAP